MRTDAGKIVEPIPWNYAVQMLEKEYKLKSACSTVIQAANARFKTMKKDEAKVYRAIYAFTEEVVRGTDGFSLPEGCGESVEKLGLTQGVPVCLVLRNLFEVYLPSTSDVVDAVQSRRVLLPGNLFGVFEAANRLCKLDDQNNLWRVMAGARTARLLFPLEATDLLKRLLKTLGRKSERLKTALKSAYETKQKKATQKVYLEDWTWELMVTVWRLGEDADRVLEDAHDDDTDELEGALPAIDKPSRRPWSAEIFVFPPQWFETSAGAEFRCEVLKSAWQQSQDDLRRELQRQALAEAENMIPELANIEGVKLSHVNELLLCLDDVASRRTVAYVPYTNLEHELVRRAGPFHEFIPTLFNHLKKLTRNTKLKPAILVPAYLSQNQPGFVSFHRHSSDVAKLQASRVTDLLSAVAEQLVKPKAKASLATLLPTVDWDRVCFYGGFQSEGDLHKNQLSLAQLIGLDVHCTNRFFQHCARLASRRA